MSESKHHVEKLQFTNSNYFCSAQNRPECIRAESKSMPDNKFCCLFCKGEMVEKCIQHNKEKKKPKPCTADIIGFDEFCEFSI